MSQRGRASELEEAAVAALKCMERWQGICNTDDYFGTMHRLRIALAATQVVTPSLQTKQGTE